MKRDNMMGIHAVMACLDTSVKQPMEGSTLDKYVLQPAKAAYVEVRKQH